MVARRPGAALMQPWAVVSRASLLDDASARRRPAMVAGALSARPLRRGRAAPASPPHSSVTVTTIAHCVLAPLPATVVATVATTCYPNYSG